MILPEPKMVSFSQLPAVKKYIIFDAAKGQIISKANCVFLTSPKNERKNEKF